MPSVNNQDASFLWGISSSNDNNIGNSLVSIAIRQGGGGLLLSAKVINLHNNILDSDGVKLVSDGYGTDVQVYIQNPDNFDAFNVFEIAKKSRLEAAVYEQNASWSSTEPVGSAVNARSTAWDVTAGALTVEAGNVTLDNTQTYRIRNSSGAATDLLELSASDNLLIGQGSGFTGDLVLYSGGGNEVIRAQADGDILMDEVVFAENNNGPADKSSITGSAANVDLYSDAHVRFFESDTNLNQFLFDLNNAEFGIGTTNPLYSLHVTDSATPVIAANDTTNGVLSWLFANDTSGTVGTATNHPFRIQSNNTTAITVDTSQNVGIGTTSPAYDLDVAGDVNFTGTLYNSGVPVGVAKFVDGDLAADAVYTDGNVGIGTTNPSVALDVVCLLYTSDAADE